MANETKVNKPIIELGPEISYIIYDEPNVMEEEGVMYGVDGSYKYKFPNEYVLKGEGRFSYGQVDYKNSGKLDNIDDYIVELRGLFGYDYSTKEMGFIPYIGVGYRYLNDDASGMTTTDGALGYERESNYFYTPIGIEVISHSSGGWSVGANIEYDLFWRGWQKSNLSSADRGYNDLENTQKDGYGWRMSFKLLKEGEKLDFIAEPFIRYWDIQESDTKNVTYAGVIIGYGYEPKNTSTEYGLKLGVSF